MNWLKPWTWGKRDTAPALDRRERNAKRSAELMEKFQRQFEAAQSDRLNKNRWSGAKGVPINIDLKSDLETLRNRCENEIQNNGILSGMVETFVADAVGEAGPMLHLTTADAAYKAKLGALWDDFWKSPEVTGLLSGAELLAEGIRGYFQAGEFIWHMVTDPAATGPVRMRVQTYHARRLKTPPEHTGERFMVYGVRRSPQGRPLQYYIQDSDEGDIFWIVSYKFTEIDAAHIIHDYKRLIPAQGRGYPWIAPVLDDAADLRDYDRSVLAAMHAATLFAVLLVTDSTDADAPALEGDYPIERQTMMAAPPGYRAEQLKPEQPGAMYAEFRGEKLTVIGRPVCMPRIKVALNSANHSYSGMRYDGQGYNRIVQALQGRLGRVALDRMFEQVLLEATRAGALPPRPADLSHSWGWPALPEVDPVKEAQAMTERLDNGTIDQQIACSHYGLDVDEVRARRKAQGMPEGPVLAAAKVTPIPAEKP